MEQYNICNISKLKYRIKIFRINIMICDNKNGVMNQCLESRMTKISLSYMLPNCDNDITVRK